MGGESELFRGAGAELYLVDGDECVLIQSGEFVLLLVKHSCSNLAAVVAMVGDMEWPVGKDCLVNKIGDTGFSFSNLPAGLRYALALDNLQRSDLQRLECLLQQYSTYMHSGGNTVNEAADVWTRIARSANGGSISDALRGTSSCGIGGVQQPMHQRCLEGCMAKRMQQARRMSAVAKLFARSVERGAITASTHVTMVEADASRGSQVAVASVDAVARVMEAVETAGRMLLESAQAGRPADLLQRRLFGQAEGERRAAPEGLDAVGRLITSGWTLNKVGLRMLFRTIASIHSKISDAASTEVLSCRLQLSSSSSNSAASLPSAASSKPRPPAHALSSLTVDNASSTQVGALRSPGARLSCPTLDITPPPHAAAASGAAVRSLTSHNHLSLLPPGRSPGAVHQQAGQPAAAQAQPLPPRFYGASALPSPRLAGAARASSLGAASLVAGPAVSPINSRLYKPNARPSPASASISMEKSPTPCPPRPPSRSPK